MTRRPLVNIAQSVHQRLLTQAKDISRPFNELLQHYGIERFERRKTDLPKSAPTAFTPAFYEDKPKLVQWRAFLNKGLVTGEEIFPADVAKVLRDFLLPPTDALVSERAFKMRWSRAGSWTK